MARKNLIDIDRLMNIPGDILFRQWHNIKQKLAEGKVRQLTGKAKKLVESERKGKDALTVAKFLSNFIPGYGKAINMGLSLLETSQESKHQRDIINQLQNLQGLDSKKNPYAEYVRRNLEGLVSQGVQTAEAKKKQSFKDNLINIAMQTGIPGKMAGENKFLEEAFPQIATADKGLLSYTTKPTMGVGESELLFPGLGPVEQFQGPPMQIPGAPMQISPGGVKKQFGPSLWDLLNFASPMLNKKPKTEALYPGLGQVKLPSLRRGFKQ